MIDWRFATWIEVRDWLAGDPDFQAQLNGVATPENFADIARDCPAFVIGRPALDYLMIGTVSLDGREVELWASVRPALKAAGAADLRALRRVAAGIKDMGRATWGWRRLTALIDAAQPSHAAFARFLGLRQEPSEVVRVGDTAFLTYVEDLP